jgi:uncharacterized membrane protein
MQGFGLSLITDSATFLLIVIVCLSALAVFWHVWLTRRMSFVNFEINEGKTLKAMIRLWLPMVVVMLVCVILPLIFVLFSPDLKDYLDDPDTTQFVNFPWSWLLPARGWGITMAFDALLGGLLYWLMGGILWIITHIR